MQIRLQFVCALAGLWSAFPIARAFSFTSGKPTQCDPISISWTGGTAPYWLLLTPVFGTPRNISIPATALSNGKGSYSTQLPFSKDQKILLTMSDSTGFGTGGSSDVLVVGPSLGGSCNTTDPGVAYPFELNTALQQCRPFTISGYDGAVQPVTIMGVIPAGNSFVLNPPVGPTTFDWDVNVASDTSIVFIMTDAQGRQGGSSDVKTVGVSGDKTCLNDLSPSSTIHGPTSTSSLPSKKATSTASTGPSAASSTSAAAAEASKKPVAAIVGAVLGTLVFLAAFTTLALFFLRRKRNSWHKSSTFPRRHSRRVRSETDLGYEPNYAPNISPYPIPSNNVNPSGVSPFLPPGTQYEPNPFLPPATQPPSQDLSHYQRPLSGPLADPFNPPYNPYAERPREQTMPTTNQNPFTVRSSDQTTSYGSMSTAQRKASAAGVSNYTPSRFILHTDVEDALPPPHNVVELPPQYSERHGHKDERDSLRLSVLDPSQPSQLPYL
jgi:hypothetical protein